MSYRDGAFDDGDDAMAFLKTLGKTVVATALAAAPAYGVFAAAAEATATNKPAPTTKPVGGGALEVRAQTAFNRGEWSLALPMLKQVAADSTDNPDRLAAEREQIRVCERQIAKAQSDAALLPPS